MKFLGQRAVPAVEEVVGGAYRRSLALPGGAGVLELAPEDGYVHARFWLEDEGDVEVALERARALLDLDADPEAVAAVLGRDQLIGPLVARSPGRRVPGHVDPHELAVRAVLGQQVSLAAANTLASRLVREYGATLARPRGGVTRLFPSAATLAAVKPEHLPMPATRRRAVLTLARSLASGELRLEADTDPREARRRLLALPGVGAWTAEYIAMRALRDADAFMAGDLGVRRALVRLGVADRARAITEAAERWRPYRAYGMVHLWSALG
ncbi:MAG: DNA-3-methyladenine glycosylase 2 family protein [Solirubrobacterales bacterium]|nr:DNA-3-methyladenine glycosylase 2 family protein [Solirubrobacterales bacterium]MBV9918318.1 DNA-3-methyladenine glycosylase 2 family protein [Solirubrobacterales bacterium]